MGLIYSTTETFESKIAPGVVYKLKKMSHGRRMKLNEKASSIFAQIDELQRQLIPIDEEIKRAEDEAKIEPCSCSHEDHEEETKRCKTPGCKCREPKPDPEIGGYEKKLKLQVEVMDVVIGKLYPEYIKWGIADIQGLNIDGKPATVDSLIEDAPEALVAEVGEEIQRLIRLSPDEVMGFKQPTISDGQVVGLTTDTTAPSASSTASTKADTAANTSQT